MKWVLITGSWRKTNARVEKDVRQQVKKLLREGKGIIVGGSLGVDFLATDEALKHDPDCRRLKVFLPTPLPRFLRFLRWRAKQGVITFQQLAALKRQLKHVKKKNPKALYITGRAFKLRKKHYYRRIKAQVEKADEVVAFWVNKSAGVGYAIEEAKKKGLPIKIFSYQIS